MARPGQLRLTRTTPVGKLRLWLYTYIYVCVSMCVKVLVVVTSIDPTIAHDKRIHNTQRQKFFAPACGCMRFTSARVKHVWGYVANVAEICLPTALVSFDSIMSVYTHTQVMHIYKRKWATCKPHLTSRFPTLIVVITNKYVPYIRVVLTSAYEQSFQHKISITNIITKYMTYQYRLLSNRVMSNTAPKPDFPIYTQKQKKRNFYFHRS